MQKLQMMTTRLLMILGSLTFLAPLVIGQEQKTLTSPPSQKTELAAIVSYVRTVDQFIRRNSKRSRTFGNVAELEDKVDKWREFKTAKQMDRAGAYEFAYVWSRNGKVVAAKFNLNSPSGDWSNFVDYYFREDGSIARIHAQLNTFHAGDGGLSVVRDKFYGSNGKLLRASTRYLDLNSQKPRKRAEFMDQPIHEYKTAQQLPFAKLLQN